ncbi:expressed unknown protein [Seminavis robusta]|uniref:SGNH hydrolase-type esterase domain-containing protein n=1 Tax=Seminavis robusta TaxID=568900 RepID=A0A9N8E1A6_9STRA|nr:expressed unknown protein [Seminavis robusta]|eukprot:Sro434_g142180.1 n/a (661) ;mRNA; r:64869-66851
MACKVRWLGLLLCSLQALYFLVTEGGRLVAQLGSTETKKTDHYDVLSQSSASSALLHLNDIFDTEFSTQESVLDHGFPLSWSPCTLRPLLSTSKALHVAVLGGSASAHSAKRCSYHSPRHNVNQSSDIKSDPYAGRYSNILMEQLLQDFFSMDTQNGHSLEFDVINMAQGATDTVWNALMLDELINTQNTTTRTSMAESAERMIHSADLLIVEYGINDALGGTTKLPRRTDQHLAQMLNLWLWRVYSLFRQQANRAPPPILFVYLWDANFYKRNGTSFGIDSDHILQHGIGQSSWKAQKRVIEHYQSQGWNIGALNVGGTIQNHTAVAHKPGILLDDKHHPNCVAMHLITAMIRHAIYSDLAHCPSFDIDNDSNKETAPMIRPMPSSNSTTTEELLDTLLEDNIKIGSIMEWEPNVGSSTLRLGHDSDCFNVSEHDAVVQADFGTKSYAWREDRKQSFTLPPCINEQPIHFTLLEPNLQWLGVGYHIFSNNMAIEMTINGVSLDLFDNGAQNHTILEFDYAKIVKDWIKISDFFSQQPPQPTVYSVSFCYKQWQEKTDTTASSDHHPMAITADVEGDCPFAEATSMENVCELWNHDNFDADASCPYEHLQTVTEACFQWWETKLDSLEKEISHQQGKPQEATTEDTVPPQLHWIVAVVRI